MKTFGIAVMSFLVLAFLFRLTFGQLVPWSLGTYSDGSRTGLINKVSKKGLFCKTYEGYMLVGNGNNVQPERFAFTIKSEEIFNKVKAYEGKVATVEYNQKVVSSLCWGDTGYEITNIK